MITPFQTTVLWFLSNQGAGAEPVGPRQGIAHSGGNVQTGKGEGSNSRFQQAVKKMNRKPREQKPQFQGKSSFLFALFVVKGRSLARFAGWGYYCRIKRAP
jgi:hypothetical protein